jgi:hypothetical protein
VPNVLKSGSLNLLETSGPVQVCNGIALPFYCVFKLLKCISVFIAFLTENKDYITVYKILCPSEEEAKCQYCDKHMWKRQKSSNKILGKTAYSGTSSFLTFIK